jgi:hypothetical protein
VWLEKTIFKLEKFHSHAERAVMGDDTGGQQRDEAEAARGGLRPVLAGVWSIFLYSI